MTDDVLLLNLNGDFELCLQDGTELKIRSARCRALIAVLAKSPKQRRSRDWLKSVLWPRSFEPQSSYSLRNALSSLRKSLGIYSLILCADRSHVWLEEVIVEEAVPDINTQFFEDAPHLGEGFEDWLRVERANHQTTIGLVLNCQSPHPDEKPCIVMCPPIIQSDDSHAALVVQKLCDQILDSLRIQSLVNVFDMRDVDSNQLSEFKHKPLPSLDIVIQVKLIKVGAFAQFSVQAQEPTTKRVLWASSISADQSSTFLFSPDQLVEFANQAVDAVQHASLNRLLSGKKRESLFSAIHQILSMSNEGQRTARLCLSKYGGLETSAVASAWYAFSFANSVGERDRRLTPEFFEEADAYCQKALELDPFNPLVLSLVSHVYGFVLRRVDEGTELAALARETAPHLAIAWDLSAMNALYSGRPAEGYAFSKVANRLGRFSPYKPLFDSSLMICASVTQDHDIAINIGQKILARRPGFLAVMRHMSGSLAAVGRIGEARKVINTIRERDPMFSLDQLSDPDYPLPSMQSVELIKLGFEKTGFVH